MTLNFDFPPMGEGNKIYERRWLVPRSTHWPGLDYPAVAIFFFTYQVESLNFSVLLTTEVISFFHTPTSLRSKSDMHSNGESIAIRCCTMGKDSSVWRTVHRRSTKLPARAGPLVVCRTLSVPLTFTYQYSAFCMDRQTGHACMMH